jgi:hypothetical protein
MSTVQTRVWLSIGLLAAVFVSCDQPAERPVAFGRQEGRVWDEPLGYWIERDDQRRIQVFRSETSDRPMRAR